MQKVKLLGLFSRKELIDAVKKRVLGATDQDTSVSTTNTNRGYAHTAAAAHLPGQMRQMHVDSDGQYYQQPGPGAATATAMDSYPLPAYDDHEPRQ